MKGKWTLLGSILAVLLLALAAGLTWAQGPEPPGEGVQPEGDVSIAATVSSKISYQGVLKENGQPVNAPRNMVFRFYTTSDCTGTPVQEVTKNNVPVSNGLFSVALEVSQNHFNGQGLWVAVDVGGTVVGCQEILPVPYALSLRPGAVISGTAVPVLRARDLDADGELATLEIISVSPFVARSVGVEGEGDWGVYGYSPDYIGVRGETGTSATSGTGVYGLAQATSGTTYGVYGRAQSPDGYGGYFENTAGSGDGVGIYGITYATGDGKGVWGEAAATSGYSIGVYGLAKSPGGTGVMGYAYANTGGAIGVYGQTNAPNGSGVYGRAFSTSGGHGVYAYSWAPAVGGSALYAENANANGIAIWGKAQGTDSTMVLEHKANSGDFIRAWQTDPSDLRFRLTVTGTTYADGSYNTPASDFAELLPAVDGLEPGDVLVVGEDGKLARSTQPYQPTVVGVYSTRPGFVGGQPVEGKLEGHIPLAVVGVVPVKASAENGPIRPGDLLVASSIPGHAMKAGPNPPVGTVIGKALEGLDEGTGIIRMLVMLQ
jgi:hypothetical protein